jgi:hypothetical protein
MIAFVNLGIAADVELTKVIDIAAHVGDISRDDVNVSYTSLLIGLLWSDDPTSLWLQPQVPQHTVKLDAIYGHRNHPEASREAIVERVAAGTPYAPRKDLISVSARTVLQEANSIARETHLLPSEPIGTRHLAAAYFFRNPPGRDRQLQIEWGFAAETWRRAFAAFIGKHYAAEAPQWSQLLTGYVATEPVRNEMPGTVLGGYVFEPAAIRVLRTAEEAAFKASPTVLTSDLLLRAIAAIRSGPDCASLAELVAKRLGITVEVPLVESTASFEAQGTTLSTSRGLKNILDRSRTLTRSSTGSERIGIRHIIASMLVAPDSTANWRLVGAGVSVPCSGRSSSRTSAGAG